MLVACSSKQEDVSASRSSEISNEVPFVVAKNYFYKNNQEGLPASPKITSAEAFNSLFGMATTMGEDGRPTEIDFAKQFVLAVVLPVTDYSTDIDPVKVEDKGSSIYYTYKVKTGEKQTYSIQPISIIILDKKYADREVVLVNE